MVLGLSASLYACGDDDDSNPGGGAGAAGGSGKGGGAGKGGSGGSSGGTAGKGGTAGGGITAGEGGALGEAGAGDSGGVGGDTGPGPGGSGGDTGPGAGGEGGAASPPPTLTLAEACTAACNPAHSLATCGTTLAACITACEGYTDLVEVFVTDAAEAAGLNSKYLTSISCMAAHLPNTAQYACAAGPAVNGWSPVAGTVCEDELCAWTCDDADSTASVDDNVTARCVCP